MALKWRLGLLSALYMAEGVPSGVFLQAFPVLLRSHHLPLRWVTLTGLLAFPWACKFLWAPWVDRWYWPRLGPRRSWIIPLQMFNIAGFIFLAKWSLEPATVSHYLYLAGLVVVINLLSATQDVASDGLAVNLLTYTQRSVGNAVQVAAFRIGSVVGGGLLLVLIDRAGWSGAFSFIALLLAVLWVPVLLFREPVSIPQTTATRKQSNTPLWWNTLCQPGFAGWVLVLITYKVGESLAAGIVKPMLVDFGYTLAQIGGMVTVLDVVFGSMGALIGGALINRLGRYSALLGFALAQNLLILCYAGVAYLHGHGGISPAWIYAANAVEHFASGMATAAILTGIMDRCRVSSAGTDFTVQVSLMTAFAGLAHLVSGRIAEAFSYPSYFLLSAALGLLALWPVWRFARPRDHGPVIEQVGG